MLQGFYITCVDEPQGHHGTMVPGMAQRSAFTSLQQYGLWSLCFAVLKERPRGLTIEEFLEGFSPHDLVGNDRMVGNQVRCLLVQDLNAMPSNQSCSVHEFVVIPE